MKYKPMTEEQFIVEDEQEIERRYVASLVKQIQQGNYQDLDPLILLKYSEEIKQHQCEISEYENFLQITSKLANRRMKNE